MYMGLASSSINNARNSHAERATNVYEMSVEATSQPIYSSIRVNDHPVSGAPVTAITSVANNYSTEMPDTYFGM